MKWLKRLLGLTGISGHVRMSEKARQIFNDPEKVKALREAMKERKKVPNQRYGYSVKISNHPQG